MDPVVISLFAVRLLTMPVECAFYTPNGAKAGYLTLYKVPGLLSSHSEPIF